MDVDWAIVSLTMHYGGIVVACLMYITLVIARVFNLPERRPFSNKSVKFQDLPEVSIDKDSHKYTTFAFGRMVETITLKENLEEWKTIFCELEKLTNRIMLAKSKREGRIKLSDLDAAGATYCFERFSGKWRLCLGGLDFCVLGHSKEEVLAKADKNIKRWDKRIKKILKSIGVSLSSINEPNRKG